MKIYFNPKAGEIYGLFTSLYYGWNIDILEGYMEKMGIKLKQEIKEEYYYINDKHSDRKEQMNFFFHDESKVFRAFMVMDKIWESKSMDEYIAYMEGLSTYSIRNLLVKTLIDNKLKNDDDHIEKIAKSKENVLNFVKELDISKGCKWDLYCFIDNIDKYKMEFISLIKEHKPTFKKLLKKQRKFIDGVNGYVIKKIDSEGIEFVKEYINNFISLDEFKHVYMTSSYFDSYLIYFTLRNNTEDCYLVVGPYYQEIANQNDYIEGYLKIFKNLSDKTRFGIMKYILNEKRYGQEIADKFNISNASVSYHMNNLLFLNLVEISKEDNKVFYKLNKKRVVETMKFLEEELCL